MIKKSELSKTIEEAPEFKKLEARIDAAIRENGGHKGQITVSVIDIPRHIVYAVGEKYRKNGWGISREVGIVSSSTISDDNRIVTHLNLY